MSSPYRRVILKLSGEVLAGDGGFGINPTVIRGLAEELRNRPELDELRRNPLLLTALCVKYKEGKRLPQDIYHLYNSVVNQVLYNRFRGSDRERTRVRWRLEVTWRSACITGSTMRRYAPHPWRRSIWTNWT